MRVNPDELSLKDKVVFINRVAKVVKGGKPLEGRYGANVPPVDLDKARETFERVFELQPEKPDALRALLTVALERKEHATAWALFQHLSNSKGMTSEFAFNLGLLLQQAGMYEEAAECYRTAHRLAPEFAPSLLNLGHTLKALGKEEESRQAWSKAIALDPSLAEGYFQ